MTYEIYYDKQTYLLTITDNQPIDLQLVPPYGGPSLVVDLDTIPQWLTNRVLTWHKDQNENM